MNDNKSKNKLKMQDIINEINNLKKYNSDLFNNINGDTLESYVNELNKNIIKAETKAETIYTENFK